MGLGWEFAEFARRRGGNGIPPEITFNRKQAKGKWPVLGGLRVIGIRHGRNGLDL